MGNDPNANRTQGKLIRGDLLEEQVERIAQPSEALEDRIPSARRASLTSQQLKLILKARRDRDKFFASDLFADPAWDMLLHAYAAMLDRKRVSLDDLCFWAAVPASTALRWVRKLEGDGWLDRDEPEERGSWVRLTAIGSEAMEHYLASVPPSLLPL